MYQTTNQTKLKMKRVKMKPKPYYSSSMPSHSCLQLLFIFCFALIISINGVVGAEESVGYGYSVESTSSDSSEKSFFADLKLIKSSSVFGSDVPKLHLTTR